MSPRLVLAAAAALCALSTTTTTTTTAKVLGDAGLFGGLESASLVGGRFVGSDEVKYTVSLQINEEHFCGGGIIGNRHVLSAAHCFMSEMNEFYNDTIGVVAGTNQLFPVADDRSNLQVRRLGVEKIYVPGNYTDSKWAIHPPFGDIAVLKLNESLDLKSNQHLMKLQLPRAHKKLGGRYQSYVDREAVIAGFGWDKVSIRKYKDRTTEFERGSSSGNLTKARATILSNDYCQTVYPHPILHSELCARVIEHKDRQTMQGVCRGDSGSPLVYKQKIVVGILNGISLGCNENKEPGLYSRVSTYVSFIKSAIKDVTDHMQVKVFD